MNKTNMKKNSTTANNMKYSSVIDFILETEIWCANPDNQELIIENVKKDLKNIYGGENWEEEYLKSRFSDWKDSVDILYKLKINQVL